MFFLRQEIDPEARKCNWKEMDARRQKAKGQGRWRGKSLFPREGSLSGSGWNIRCEWPHSRQEAGRGEAAPVKAGWILHPGAPSHPKWNLLCFGERVWYQLTLLKSNLKMWFLLPRLKNQKKLNKQTKTLYNLWPSDFTSGNLWKNSLIRGKVLYIEIDWSYNNSTK